MQNFLNKKIFLFFVNIFLLFSFVGAEKVVDLKATDYVNDYTETLSVEEKLSLSKILGDLEKQTGDQVSVFLINSMEGDNGRSDYIEHFSVQLYQSLGLSTKNKQAGTLFLISKNDRKMRIEIGYGLEATLTDGVTRNILDNRVRPSFKNNDYFGGIKNGVNDISTVLGVGVVADARNAASDELGNSVKNFGMGFQFVIVLFLFSIHTLVWFGATMARSKSWWLGGVLGAAIGAFCYFLIFANIFGIVVWVFVTVAGALFDYFISRNYKYYLNNPSKGLPGFFSGGTWGPGSGGFSGRDGGSGFGGFGGGGFSGGGGSSSSW